MQKYKIIITQTEKYIIDTYANSQEEAEELAIEAFNNGDCQETGEIETDISDVFDITNTDDPFNPINDIDTLSNNTNK